MKVIRHNTVAEYSHGDAPGTIEQVNDCFVISAFPKNLLTAIAAIDNLVANPTDRSSRRSWHAPLLP